MGQTVDKWRIFRPQGAATMTEPPHMLVVRELQVPLEADDTTAALATALATRLRVGAQELPPWRVHQRALDTRRQQPRYVFTVRLHAPAARAQQWCARGVAERDVARRLDTWRLTKPPDGPPPLVIGAGPAGLFAALTLAEAGWPPVVLERGKSVDERGRDVSRLYAHGELNPESNVCYGEGGAGTYSDGKLYTRIKDPRAHWVLERLVSLGADPDILINTRPHLGTDRLVMLLQNLRAHLIQRGVTFRFGARVDDLHIADGCLRGVRLAHGEQVEARAAVLATGHSARHIYERCIAAGLPLEARPFALGVRLEHPQAHIDGLRYGRFANHPELPAADYRLTHTANGRGAYSFCMCPGGVIVPTPTTNAALCLNGMSHAARSGRFANSAIVMTVGPEDYPSADTLAGVGLQEAIERAAFVAGSGAFAAPAQRLTDFLSGDTTSDLGATSYRRGVHPFPIGQLFPPAVTSALRDALRAFERSLPGFITREAQLLGVETRTAAPIRLPRDATFQALGARGLYPAGEGMGYGGGIVSAAVDGRRVADALLKEVGAFYIVEAPPIH